MMSLQGARDETVSDTEILPGIEELIDFRRAEMFCDGGILRQNLSQMPAFGGGAQAGGFDELVSSRAAEFFSEGHGHSFGKDQAARCFQVFEHFLWMNLDAGERFGKMMERAADELHDFRKSFPFGVPAAQAALVLLGHG